MNKTIISVLAAGTLVLAACNSDDGGASGVQGEAAQQAIDQAADEGIELDEGCVNDLANDLSDEDAQAIVDAGPDGDADLSETGEATTAELLDCIDPDALVDLFIQGMLESGEDIDEDCVREALEDIDLTGVINGEDPSTELITAVVECTNL